MREIRRQGQEVAGALSDHIANRRSVFLPRKHKRVYGVFFGTLKMRT
jgi:hypothetical protein